MSWNVGRLYNPTGNNRLADAHVPRVADALRLLAPDVVLLQEVASVEQLARLLEMLPGHAAQLAERCSYDRQVAALARVALAPAFEQHRLEPTGRGLVAVTFDFEGSRAAAHAIHLDVRDARRKRSQVEAILEIAQARSEPLVVLGGDFNLDPVWARRLRMSVEAGSFDRLLTSFVDVGAASGPTLLGLLQLDHLLVRPPLERRSTVTVARAFRLPLGDHAPIVLDVV